MNQSKILLTLAALSSLSLAPVKSMERPNPFVNIIDDRNETLVGDPIEFFLSLFRGVLDARRHTEQCVTDAWKTAPIELIDIALQHVPFAVDENNRWIDVINAAAKENATVSSIINVIIKNKLLTFMPVKDLLNIIRTKELPEELRELAKTVWLQSLHTPREKRPTELSYYLQGHPISKRYHKDYDDDDTTGDRDIFPLFPKK